MCELLTDFDPTDCTDLERGGVSGDVYLINWDDWLKASITKAADGTITGITLTNPTSKAVKYGLTRGGAIPTATLTINNGGKSGYLHSVGMFIPTKSQAIKKELTSLVNFNRAVAIVVLDSGVVANVFGNDMGLQMTSYNEAPNDPAKGGGIDIILTTPGDTTLENLPPATFFDTSRAATIAELEALLVAVPSV